MRWTPFLVLFLLLALAGCGSDDRPSLAEQAEASEPGEATPVEEVSLTAPTSVSASGTAVAKDEPLPVGPPGNEKFILVLPEDDTDPDVDADLPTGPIQVIVDEPVEIDLADDELPIGPPSSVEAGRADTDAVPASDDPLPTGPPGDSAGPDLVIDFGDDLPPENPNDGATELDPDDPPVSLARVIAEAKASA